MDGAEVKRGEQREEQNKKEGKGKEMVRGRGMWSYVTICLICLRLGKHLVPLYFSC